VIARHCLQPRTLLAGLAYFPLVSFPATYLLFFLSRSFPPVKLPFALPPDEFSFPPLPPNRPLLPLVQFPRPFFPTDSVCDSLEPPLLPPFFNIPLTPRIRYSFPKTVRRFYSDMPYAFTLPAWALPKYLCHFPPRSLVLPPDVVTPPLRPSGPVPFC